LIEQANPELSRREVVNILFATTDNISRLNPNYSGQLGNGRLNVDRAVEMAKEELYSRIGRLIVIPATGQKEIKITAENGDLAGSFPDKEKFHSGQSLTSGDVDGDGQNEIIFGAAPGSDPTVAIYNSAGKLLKKLLVFPKTFRGGVNVAALDVNNDNRAEILVVPATGGAGQVKIMDFTGHLLKQFVATDKTWRGGLNIAGGDIDGNGQPEIVVAYGAGNSPQVRIFSTAGLLLKTFSPYEMSFRGGVKIAVSNIDGRANHSRAKIITAPGRGRDPLVKIFDQTGKLTGQFLAYNKRWQGGMNLTAGDLNNDGVGEIAVGALGGATPHVRVFDSHGMLLESFYAYESGWSGGVNIGIIKIAN
jgi:hypothetical protein